MAADIDRAVAAGVDQFGGIDILVNNVGGRRINRAGFSLVYTTRRTDSQVELWIAHGAGHVAGPAGVDELGGRREGDVLADVGEG